MSADLRRRKLILGAAGMLLAQAVPARPLQPTPPQTAGPFYPEKPPLDDDNDLTRVRGRSGTSQGQVTDLDGHILDQNGDPLSGLRVEIWQCDATGRYHHPRDRGGDRIDADFQGFGHTVTDDDGRYRFRTIRPVPYPGRTPHIHAAVFPPGERPFVTQLYVKDEPRNDSDFLFNRIPAEQRHLVVAEFKTADGDAEFSASFDIVLAGSGGTPRA